MTDPHPRTQQSDDLRRVDDTYRDQQPPPGASGAEDEVTGTTTEAPGTGDADARTTGENREQLVPRERAQAYGARWDAVKVAFVDDPRQAVAQADALVGELLDELERLFRDQRRDLEHGLDADKTSTEDLRLALRRYRSFFDRLLSL